MKYLTAALFACAVLLSANNASAGWFDNVPTGYKVGGCKHTLINYAPGRESICDANGEPAFDGYALIEQWSGVGGGGADDAE